jgi:hypothetical protein
MRLNDILTTAALIVAVAGGGLLPFFSRYVPVRRA